MGEVYRATDTRLKRQVAIKVLPASLAQDADRLARFQREAEVLASLNHPNIAAIHGLEEVSGVKALVMELVEGATLADRIAQGAIPVDEAPLIAKQIAEALEAAHEQGIIHRDLKPANIKVRPDGTVKVLDFGLAKAMEPTAGQVPTNVSQLPTVTTPAMTQAGVILGTAAYMSPEQAKGRPVDRRADIWAFGCVLYEMLTGRRAFGGDDIAGVLARVIEREPDWAALPALPPRLRTLLARTLDKDPRKRLRDIGEARVVLDGPGASVNDIVPSTVSRRAWPWIGAGLAIGVVASFAWFTFRDATVPGPSETRLEIATPPSDDLASFALSPDGTKVAYVAFFEGASRLWVRPMSSVTPQPLPGTEGAAAPFWSPDSRSLGFFAAGKLRRVDLEGGSPQVLANASGARGGAWGEHGDILFASSTNSGIFRVSASGGEPAVVTARTPDQISHRFPVFLPGGNRFLFFIQEANGAGGIYISDLAASAPTRVTDSESAPMFLPPDRLLYVQQGVLKATAFDTKTGTASGTAVSVATDVRPDPSGSFQIAASASRREGLIAYRASLAASTRLMWFDRTGRASPFSARPEDGQQPSISPDGQTVSLTRTIQGNTDVWLLGEGRMTRFTFGPQRERYALWSDNGQALVYSSEGKAGLDLWRKRASGEGEAEPLLASRGNKFANDITPDGRWLVFVQRNETTNADLYYARLEGDRTPHPLVQGPFEETHAQFSPNGRWVAYESDESGRPEIYLRPFPGPGGQWQVSTGGGITPRWSRDGKQLYYLAPDGTMTATALDTSASVPHAGQSSGLFQTHAVYGGTSRVGVQWQFDVAPDGRFLVNTNNDVITPPITIIQNWNPRR